MRRKYDLVLGVGNACSCSQILRKAGLQLLSFPFDWIVYAAPDPVGAAEHDLRDRADRIATGFEGWLRREDLAFHGVVDGHDRDIYRNTATGVIFNHEFSRGADLDVEFPQVAAKYDRRIRRLLDCLQAAKSVLVVRVDRPNQPFVTSADDIDYLLKRLQGRFPSVTFDVLHLTRKTGIPPAECREERLSEHAVRLAFDYKDYRPDAAAYDPDIWLVAKMLKARYAVRDYRTRAERRSHRRAEKLKKYAQYGATSYLRYRVNKFRRRLAETMAAVNAFWHQNQVEGHA